MHRLLITAANLIAALIMAALDGQENINFLAHCNKTGL
jgi:hypothetical protein